MKNPNFIFFENDRVFLRLIEKQDLDLVLSWRNQDNIRKWFLHTEPISLDSHIKWFDQYRKLKNDYVFIIIAKDFNDTPVGQVSLYKIDYKNKNAEYGRLMIGHPDAIGKGYAKQATKLLIDGGFQYFLLKEIYLEVKIDNYKAIGLYLDCGFKITKKENNIYTMRIYNE